MENKMLDCTYSAQKQLLQENLDIVNIKNGENNAPFMTNLGRNTGGSLLMSVVDETFLENSHNLSIDRNVTLNENLLSPCPEKSQYILPEGLLNMSEVQLEKTLYLPNCVANTSSSSEVDPLKSSDKTMSNFTNAWLNFDKFNKVRLDESESEFHDAQVTIEELDPLSSSVPAFNKVEESLFADLKKLLCLENTDNVELLSEVKEIIESIESVKISVLEDFPDLAGVKVDIIVKTLLDNILQLKLKKISLSEKNKALFYSLNSTQNSIEQLKNIKNSISTDLVVTQNYVIDSNALIFKNIEKINNNILIQSKDKTEEIECLVTDLEKLKNDFCCVSQSNQSLKESLEKYEVLLLESSSKCEQLLTEQNSLRTEFEKVKRDYDNEKEVSKELKENVTVKINETHDLNNEILNLQSTIASSETVINENERRLKLVISENGNLQSEVSSLKEQLNSCNSDDLNEKIKKQSNHLSSLETDYNLLKTNHNELLNKFLDAQKKVDSVDKSLLKNDEVIDGVKKILRALDFDDDFDVRDNIELTLSKIQRRVSLLLEHQSDVDILSSANEVSELNQKIKSLESDLYDASSFKLSFTKELRSLKPELDFNNLLKRSLSELHGLMITEIMSRENTIISNLKSEYDNKIISLKDQLHQVIEKDKRRTEWVSEVENDNEQLNIMSRKLKEDIHSATERLESKVLCEKYMIVELKKLEHKINNDVGEQTSSQDIDLDIIKKGEVSGEILVKLQKIVKNYLPSDESACYLLNKYKEKIKTLEGTILELEQLNLDCSKEITELKSSLNDKAELHKTEVDKLNRSIKTLESNLGLLTEKLNFTEEIIRQKQEQLQREKAFSLKTLKDNEFSKKQLEEHIEHLCKINMELSDAKETIKSSISKHEDEICSLMKVITDLEGELKLSRRTEEEKGSIESELVLTNKKLSVLQQEYSSQITILENENKTLKNEINMKHKEISILKEEHDREINALKYSASANIDMMKNTNDNYVSKISLLESELFEKEALYRDSIAKLMREREGREEDIKSLEELSEKRRIKIEQLENKLAEFDTMCNLMSSDSKVKEINYTEKMQEMERFVAELKNKLEETEQSFMNREKAHAIQVNDLNDKINEYLVKTSQLDKSCMEIEQKINIEMLKLFPESSLHYTELLPLIKTKLDEVTTLKEELEEKKSECKYLEEDCDEMIKNVKELQKRIGEVCRAQFEDETKYKSQLSEKDTEIEKLQNQLSKHSANELNEIKQKESIIIKLEKKINVLENHLKENKISITNLMEENVSLRKQISEKPTACKECEQIMDKIINFKAKLTVKEVKIAELTKKIIDIDTQKKEISKENDSVLKTYIEKIEELEKEKVRLTTKMKSDHQSASPLKENSNQLLADPQVSITAKLESRISKLEKDREFLKALCEKRGKVINELKQEYESRKK